MNITIFKKELSNEGRILLRPSGTEELIRIMVEAKTEELTNLYCEKLEKIIREKY